MTSKTQLMLGGFKFEVGKNSFNQLSEELIWKWNEIERAKSPSSLQFQSRKLDVLKIKGRASTVDCGMKTFDDLIKKSNRGEPLSLVDCEGNFHGRYVVEKINKTSESFIGGLPRIIEFEIGIKKFD